MQSTEEGRPASEITGLNTNMNAAESMQLSNRELIADAVWRRENKYTFYKSGKTPLDTAVQACNVKFLDIFLDCVYLDEQVKTRMASNAYTNFFHREFSQITKDHIAMVKRLLEFGADVNGEPSVFPLSVATKAGCYPLVELLCQHGADLNKRDRTCYTPLCIAAESGHYGMIEVMLRFGANVHDAVMTYSTVDLALDHDHIDCAKLLLQHGANFDLESAFLSLRSNQSVAYINFLIVVGRHETQQYICKHQQDLLLSAVRGTNIEFISYIIYIIFDIAGEYPCLEKFLAYSGNKEIVTFLIRKGADVNKLVDGNTVLLHAINRINKKYDPKPDDIVTALINAGCDVNLQNNDGLSPLMLAVSRYSKEIVQTLLDAGADINAVSETDRTKTAVSYFQPIYNHDINITAWLAVFLAQGACLSYLQPKIFHRLLFCNNRDTIYKLMANVAGPMTIWSGTYFNNFFSPADPTFDISPLFTALVSGNASLARHFVDIMWLTKSDLTSLMHNKPVRSYLEKKNHTPCLNLLDEMSSQPASLFRLAFVEVSSAVGTTSGRENCVNKLPLPQLLKDKLLFKSAADFLTSTLDRFHFRLLPSDPSPDINISVLDYCKCCRVWQNLGLNPQFRNEYTCFTCAEHDCSECFAAF